MTEESHPCDGIEKHPAFGLEGIEILNEPLLTDEGFLNEACLKELEATINRMPESWERLTDNPEWSIQYPVVDTEIIGYLAGNAVRQFRGCPPHLVEVVEFVHACLLKGPFAGETDHGGFRIACLSLCDINRLLWEYLRDLKYFTEWNDEKVVGKHWVDLSALLHNVCIDVRDARRHALAFDIAFVKEHPRSAGAVRIAR